MKHYLVTSVPHTGTNYLISLFPKEWAKQSVVHYLRDSAKPPEAVWVDHIFPDAYDIVKRTTQQMPTIVPLRHPIVCAYSWEEREKDVGLMCDLWRQLVRLDDELGDLYYVPLDVENTQQYATTIRDCLGLEFDLSNPPISLKGNDGLRAKHVRRPDPKVMELCEEIGDFLDRFYDHF